MAIKIPKNMIFGTPDIELITDNKINQISYTDNFISNINQTSQTPYKYKNIFSKGVTCWVSQDSNDPNKYIYNGDSNNENVELKSILNGNDTIFYAVINLNKIKSDLYYSIYHPDDYAYVEIKQNFTGVPYDSKGNGAGYWVVQYDELTNYMGELSSKLVSNTSSISHTSDLFTTSEELTTSDISKLAVGQVVLYYPSTSYEYSDEFTGKLYVGLGKLSPIYTEGILDVIMLSFDINFYYPSMELQQTEHIINNETENVASSYIMETNTFMNSYPINYVSGNRFTTFEQQAKDILFNYENGRLRARITCNYGQYMNSDGTLAYSGTDGKTIKIGDVVELNLSRVDREFEVLKSEIVYSGNIRVNLTLEETSKVFGITENLGDGVLVTYNRTYSEIGSIGIIKSQDKLYENDVIVINVSFTNNEAYNLNSIIVNGQNFTNGDSIIITKNLNVYATSSVKTFTISSTIGEGITPTITRESSPYGNGSLGLVDVNSAFYYGDVLIIGWKFIDYNYEVRDAYFNEQRLYQAITNRVTITQNSTLIIPTIKLGWTTLWEGEWEYNMLENHGTENEIILDLVEMLDTNIYFQEKPVLLTFERIVCRYGDLSQPSYNLNGFEGYYGRDYFLDDTLWGGDLEGASGSFRTEPYMKIDLYRNEGYPTSKIKINRTMGSYKHYNQYEDCVFAEFKLTKIQQYISV